jgi:sarcosine oxidase
VQRADVIVIGLGVYGAAVCHQLAARGVGFIALEARARGHLRGSSHGHSRASRQAVGEGMAYVPLVRRSDAIWDALEAEGHDLRRRTGLLYMRQAGDGASRHGDADFLAATEHVAAEAGIALHHMDAAAIRAAFPRFQVTNTTIGVFEPGASVLRPEACIDALLAGKTASGGALRYEEPVRAITREGDVLVVETGQDRYRARRVIAAMGPWVPGFVGGAYARDLRVFRQVQFWFASAPAADAPMPAFLWFHGTGPEDVFYGFPPLDDAIGAVKVATEQYAVSCPPDDIDFAVSEQEIAVMYARHVAGRILGVTAKCVAALACCYTHNTDPARQGRFLIGPHPALEGVTVISACSGHGFKHAPGVAEALVRDILGEPPLGDLAPFRPH